VFHRPRCGQALAYVYFEGEPGRRSAAHLLAANIAEPPKLLRGRLPISEA
jgi:hypothetical protein